MRSPFRELFARQPLGWTTSDREGPALRRVLGWPALTAIGLGTMLGGHLSDNRRGCACCRPQRDSGVRPVGTRQRMRGIVLRGVSRRWFRLRGAPTRTHMPRSAELVRMDHRWDISFSNTAFRFRAGVVQPFGLLPAYARQRRNYVSRRGRERLTSRERIRKSTFSRRW